MEQPPGHGADLVDEAQGGFGLCAVDGARLGQQSQVGVNLLRGSECDSPVVDPVSAEAPVTLMNDPEVIMREGRSR